MDGDSIDLSLLRATALDASPFEITANLASQRAEAPEPRAPPVPLSPDIEVRRSRSPDQPPSPSQGNSLPGESPYDAQPRSLLDARKRMTAAGTQRSDRTDPLSQWAYDHTPGQSRSHIAGTTGYRTVPDSTTYHTGEWGHVELDLEPEVEAGRHAGGFETQDAEDLNELPDDEQLEPLTELFPYSQRFQQPKTPASTTRKRKRNGGPDETTTTPGLPANPFGSSAIKGAAPMRMSQVFKATQAPSSPFQNPLVSDPLSSRPSPNLHQADRPATAHATSSPAKPSELSRRAATEPHVNWKSQSEYDAQDRDSSPLQPLDAGLLSDDDGFGLTPGRERQTALRAERAKATRELRSVQNGNYLRSSLRSDRKAIASGAAPSARVGRRSPPTTVGGLHPTESEEETEHEEDDPSKPLHATQLPDDGDEFAENNKENIAQPMNHRVAAMNSSGVGGMTKQALATDREHQSDDELPTSTASLARGAQKERTSSQSVPHKTIADSQLSPQPKYRAAPNSTGIVPRSTGDDSSKIVCESQTLRETASSPPIGSSDAVNLLDATKVAFTRHSGTVKPAVRSGFTSSHGGINANEQATTALSKEDSSGLVTAPQVQDSKQTPSRKDDNAITIPETTFASRVHLRREAQARRSYPHSSLLNKDSKRSSQETGVFHSARNQPKESTGLNSDLTTPGSSQPSSGPVASQPIPLMEVGRRAALATEEESISMSPEILQTNDPLYEEVMEKYSSPISALRKRRAREDAARMFSQKPATTRAAATVQPVVKPSNDETVTDNGVEYGRVSDVSDEPKEMNNQVHVDTASMPPPASSNDNAHGAESKSKQSNSRTRHTNRNQPLRVFAYFSGSRSGFYPATCLSIARSEPKFRVKFDDGNVTSLNSTKVKPLHLQPGDSIRIDVKGLRNTSFSVQRCEAGKERATDDVLGTDNDGNRDVVVHRPVPAGSAEAEDEIFTIDAVYLTNQAWTAFRREFRHEDLAQVSASGHCTPSERPSSPSTPNSRVRRSVVKENIGQHAKANGISPSGGIFAGVVFVMTNIDPPSLRKEIGPRITQNGGRVLEEGFEVLFTEETADPEPVDQASRTRPGHEGSSSSLPPPTSSPQPPGSSALRPRPEYRGESVFLLATRHCRHTKYLQALALGIPCLSIRWIDHCIAQGTFLPWHNYLLASGESAFLDDAVVSQSMTVARLAPRYTLQELVDRQYCLLGGQRVLLLNLDDSRASQLDAHHFLALALGASEIYRASDLDKAQDLLAERNRAGSTQQPWTLMIGSASELLDTASSGPGPGAGAGAGSSARSTKRRKAGGGGGRRSERERDREQDEDDAATLLTRLVEPYPGVRGVSTEFVIQSLIQGRLL